MCATKSTHKPFKLIKEGRQGEPTTKALRRKVGIEPDVMLNTGNIHRHANSSCHYAILEV